jgi:hypothetical protein
LNWRAPLAMEKRANPAKGDEMANTYRRRRNRDTWHFCSNCSNWPTTDYVERDSKPATGEPCEAKQRNNNCR